MTVSRMDMTDKEVRELDSILHYEFRYEPLIDINELTDDENDLTIEEAEEILSDY